MKKNWDKYDGKTKYDEGGRVWDGVITFVLNFFAIIFVFIGWILKLIWKFVKDVLHSMYGKVVALIASGVLIYFLSHFFRK